MWTHKLGTRLIQNHEANEDSYSYEYFVKQAYKHVISTDVDNWFVQSSILKHANFLGLQHYRKINTYNYLVLMQSIKWLMMYCKQNAPNIYVHLLPMYSMFFFTKFNGYQQFFFAPLYFNHCVDCG